MPTIDRLRADLQALPANYRVLVWSGFDQSPYDGTMFREYLFRRDELLAALSGQPAPPPTTITVKVATANGLRVRQTPVNGAIVATLANETVIEVYEPQTTQGWWQISAGAYAGMYVSAQYTERL